MPIRKITNHIHPSVPKLAATALICWALSLNTHFDNANLASPSWHSAHEALIDHAAEESPAPSFHILTEIDAELYRTVFDAQDRSDWKTADAAMAHLGDKRLLGHVLADRYERRDPAAGELKTWLTQYADLPEADELYEKAKQLPGAQADLAEPSSNLWSGGDEFAGSFNLRMASKDRKGLGTSIASRKFTAKLNKALQKGDPLAAQLLFESEQRHRAIAPHETATAEGLIAASYFYSGKLLHARHMASLGAKEQNPLALWVEGLTDWKLNDMRPAGNAFALLATQAELSDWDRAAAQFWAWRALKRAGDSKNAHYWLEQAAHQPHSFYGVMAAHLLGNDNSWSWEVPTIDNRRIAIVARQKAGSRALALLQIGQKDLAEEELRHINPQGQRDLQEAMLALASSEHMPSLALQLGGVATRADGSLYDAALYPVPPWRPAEGFKVDRALIYALMRHESQFDPEAVSDRGACGLMQILPATAVLMTRDGDTKLDPSNCSASLLDPDTNVALGQKYVRYLTEQPVIGNNLLLLLAAYNEGPGKLAHDIPSDAKPSRKVDHHDFEKGDPLFFLESLPVRQTHDYIQQVFIHYWGYRARLGESEATLTDLAQGAWPHYVPLVPARPAKGIREAASPDGSVILASYEKTPH